MIGLPAIIDRPENRSVSPMRSSRTHVETLKSRRVLLNRYFKDKKEKRSNSYAQLRNLLPGRNNLKLILNHILT